MSDDEQREKRAKIKKILEDASIPASEKQRHIQAVVSTFVGFEQPAPTPDPSREEPPLPSGPESCVHYQSKASILAPCCNKWFPCRQCHDEAADHKLDRYITSRMYCRDCRTPQPVSQTCNNSECGVQMAKYYCAVCHLWEDGDRSIYHCDACRICRIGKGLGIDYFHCTVCDACLTISSRESHQCRENVMRGNCCICHDDLFTSTQSVVFMRCGHPVHGNCMALIRGGSCPICRKSMSSPAALRSILEDMLRTIQVPTEFANWKARIFCNDCYATSEVRETFELYQCSTCKSFNTARQARIPPPPDAAANPGEASAVPTNADASAAPTNPDASAAPTNPDASAAPTNVDASVMSTNVDAGAESDSWESDMSSSSGASSDLGDESDDGSDSEI